VTGRTSDDLAADCPEQGAPLDEVQAWMAKLFVHSRSLSKSEAMRKAAARHFAARGALSAAECLDIYRRQFWLRHTSVLIEDFPGVSGLLGQRAWEAVAESYLSECGQDVIALADLGKGLPQHLERCELSEEVREQRQLLVDMARLECAYMTAFDAQDDPVLSLEKVAKIPPSAWPAAVLRTSHSLRLLDVDYPVSDLRRRVRTDPASVDKSALVSEKRHLVVYRRDFGLFDKSLSLPAFLLLKELSRGVPLVPACEHVVEREPSAERVFDEQLTEWFTLWGRLGWIVDVESDAS
jgi:hypothetical protein